jgi:hypothetical protein
MAGVRFHRLSPDGCSLIFLHVKRENQAKENTMTTHTYRNLTPAELYAIELRARRQRQEELGRLLRAAAVAVKAAYERAVSHFNAKGVKHA